MSDLFDLTGTTAVVTGSSRGIGLAIARTLLGQGASVLINGYDPAETAATFQTLRATTPAAPDGRPRLAQSPGDIATPEVAQQLVDEAVTAFGHLDHLICNAGSTSSNRPSTTPPTSGTASWRATSAARRRRDWPAAPR